MSLNRYIFDLKEYNLPFISNLQMPGCPSKQDMFELATIWYLFDLTFCLG